MILKPGRRIRLFCSADCLMVTIKLYELNNEGYNFDTSWSTTRLY